MKITLYTDGACRGNPGPGGYAAILTATNTQGELLREIEVTGGEPETTNNRMEIRAVIEGLNAIKQPSTVEIVSDSQYVIYTMTRNWKRKANLDLWDQLDDAIKRHTIRWRYVKGHAGHDYNERCDKLAVAAASQFQK